MESENSERCQVRIWSVSREILTSATVLSVPSNCFQHHPYHQNRQRKSLRSRLSILSSCERTEFVKVRVTSDEKDLRIVVIVLEIERRLLTDGGYSEGRDITARLVIEGGHSMVRVDCKRDLIVWLGLFR